MNKGVISYGQHYLDDIEVQKFFIESANITNTDVVLEVGAGDGRLTQLIAKKAKKVVSFEIDVKTKAQLVQIAKKFQNVEFVFDNFLNVDLKNYEFDKIVSSLPYQITEPFIQKIKNLDFESTTLIVGKTFAKNACSLDLGTTLGILTNCFFDVTYVKDVEKAAFSPAPKTISSIIVLRPKQKSQLLQNQGLYLMREIFEQKDKKLKNAMKEAFINYFHAKNLILTQKQSKEIIREFVKNLDNEDVYVEQLSNEKLVELFKFVNALFCCI